MLRALNVLKQPLAIAVAAGLVLINGCGPILRSPNPARTVTTPARVTIPPPVTIPASPTAHFTTLPVGSALPSDAYCAAHVRAAAEIHPDNNSYNSRSGSGTPSGANYFLRVTGNYTGTTDQIIQWGACKWGIDEDIVRAQAAQESTWHQNALGDFGTDASACAPGHSLGSDGRPGQCPQSVGLMQVRYPYWAGGFPGSGTSTAYNLDEALAGRRDCFEGRYTWIGNGYAAGDIWGCVGAWFSGQWKDASANQYIAEVRAKLASRVWEQPGF